jgi:hypothetical protein
MNEWLNELNKWFLECEPLKTRTVPISVRNQKFIAVALKCHLN